MNKIMSSKSSNSQDSYAELSRQLDEVIAKLQDPEVAVDDATRYYEQAMKLIKQLEKHLARAENRVQTISAKFVKDA